MPVEMLEPWYAVENEPEREALGAQLIREVGPRHILHGLTGTLIARRQDNDDCLFHMSDGRFAYVHLTWRSSQESDPRWPAASVYPTLDAWITEVMLPANADWRDDD